MSNGDLGWITNFIWGIADDVLRDLYVRGKYRDVILPMTVLRRLDAVLEPTKPAVMAMKQKLDKARVVHQEAALQQAAAQPFYNTSKFTLRDLRSRASQQQLKADFEAYLDGFSPNVQDILEKFEFRNQIPRLSRADALGTLIEKFLDPSINLSPDPVKNGDGSVKLPGLDNHAMGTMFEELVRRFNEENNEEAGEHWTPRDVVKLMARLIFLPIADQIESGTYLLYDGACGTGGMLTVGEETLKQLAMEHGKQVSTHLYGQDINQPHCRGAQRLIAVHRRRRSGREQHPPLDHRERLAGSHYRAAAQHVLQHRHRHLHLGVSNRKATHRQRKVQLIDATTWFKPLRKNLGKKNCELSEDDIKRICDTFLVFGETEQSKIFDNAAFGYWKVTVERPLRLRVKLSDDARKRLRAACVDADEEPLANLIDHAAASLPNSSYDDFNVFIDKLRELAAARNIKLTVKRLKLIQNALAERDPDAAPVISGIYKLGKMEPDPFHGRFPATIADKDHIVEYEPDSELRDTEQIPLQEPGGIEAFIRREVLPHAPDAWVDKSKTEIGYEISFHRYFYQPQPLRSLEEIRADILALEKETEGLLGQILGSAA